MGRASLPWEKWEEAWAENQDTWLGCGSFTTQSVTLSYLSALRSSHRKCEVWPSPPHRIPGTIISDNECEGVFVNGKA